MEFNLKQVLKTLLLSTSEPVSIKDIQAVISRYHDQREKEAAREAAAGVPTRDGGPGGQDELKLDDPERQGELREIIAQVPTLLTATQIREAIEEMNRTMTEAGEVTRILQGPEGFRLAIAPAYAEWVRLLRNDPKPRRLTQAQLETLAVVAYRQPVTRSEIEALRGVSADSALAYLQDVDLVIVTGRADLPGRPIQYGTGAKFLEFAGVKTLSELPASDVLTPSQINEWIARATNPAAKADNKAVGLAPEERTGRGAAQLELLADEPPARAAAATSVADEAPVPPERDTPDLVSGPAPEVAPEPDAPDATPPASDAEPV